VLRTCGELAVLYVPTFTRIRAREHIDESAVLHRIRDAQELFRKERGAYVSFAMNPSMKPGGSLEDWEKRPCPETCRTEVSACTEASCLTFLASDEVRYRYLCETSKDEYVCVALSDFNRDGDPGVYIIGSANGGGEHLRMPVPAMAAGTCKDRYPANRLSYCNNEKY
jgi:hypothetical protein